MNDYRDDETEPMTRLLGVVVREPREGEPQKRLVDLYERKPAELTRLEIAPRTPPSEPATQIMHPSLARPDLSLSTATLPGPIRRPPAGFPAPSTEPPPSLDRESPVMPIKPVFAPRLAQADQQEITASRAAPRRAMPILLGIAIVMFIALGASLFRDRARASKRAAAAAAAAAAQVESKSRAPAHTTSSSPLTAQTPAPPAAAEPAAQPDEVPSAPAEKEPPELAVASAPAAAAAGAIAEAAPEAAPVTAEAKEAPPPAPLDPAAFAELEKRAVDRLRANDHEAALGLYTELARAEPQNPAFSVMVSLLTRRVAACKGDPTCAR